MDERGCVDELLAAVPFHGCQMKWVPHEPWGVPTQELAKSFKPSVFMSGYIKREPCSQNRPRHQHALSGWPGRSLPACLSRGLRHCACGPSLPCCEPGVVPLRAGRKPEQKTFIRLHSAPVTQLLVVTSVPQEHCTLARGNLTNLMGILNKQARAPLCVHASAQGHHVPPAHPAATSLLQPPWRVSLQVPAVPSLILVVPLLLRRTMRGGTRTSST